MIVPLSVRRHYWAFIVTSCFFILYSPAVHAQTPDEALQKTTELVVKIDGVLAGAPTLGGGIIFGREKDTFYIATANHVIRRGEEEVQNLLVTFKFHPGVSLPGILLKDFDSNLDLALVRVDGLKKNKIDVCDLSLNRLGEPKELKRGSSVFAVGHPNGVAWFLPSTADPVAQMVGDFIGFESFRVGKGHSGGALLNGDGGLVGMIRADQPPFGQAVNFESILRFLKRLDYPVQLRSLSFQSYDLIYSAAKENNVQALRTYAKGEICFPLDLSRIDGSRKLTPLHVAVENRSIAVAIFFLKNGADPNIKNGAGQTPLHLATEKGLLEIANILLKNGADPNVKNGAGQTPLHLATEKGLLEIADILLNAGADIHEKNDRGNTVLHVAIAKKQIDLILFFLRLGADLNVRNKEGQTPLALALTSGNAYDPNWARLVLKMQDLSKH